jgi:hypothetical protein
LAVICSDIDHKIGSGIFYQIDKLARFEAGKPSPERPAARERDEFAPGFFIEGHRDRWRK